MGTAGGQGTFTAAQIRPLLSPIGTISCGASAASRIPQTFSGLGRAYFSPDSAGVGENDTEVRQDSLYNLDMYGIHFDKERNLVRSDQPRMISTEDSPVKVFVVPTNEELAIAQKSAEIAAMAREAGLYK